MKNYYIIISSLIACFILYLLEQVFYVNYLTKTVSKLVLFILIPLIFIYLIKKIHIKEALNLKQLSKRDLKYGFLLGMGSFVVVLLAYAIFHKWIDLSQIKKSLEDTNITSTNFIFIAFYITFINSFLEEFFFRGFIFLNLLEISNKKIAYGFSSLLFAIYHIAIFKTWFNVGLILLALLGLIIIGLIFNYIDTKSKNFINSWMVHILADASIMVIGFKLFGII